MKKAYICPSMEIAVADGMTQLLAGSYTIDGELGGGTGGETPGRSRGMGMALDEEYADTPLLGSWGQVFE